MAFTDPRVNQSSADVIAILDADDFTPLFVGVDPMRVTVKELAKLTKYEVEDGTERTDHMIFEAVEIEMPMVLSGEFRDLYRQLKDAFLAGRELVIQTKTDTYPSMLVYEMPHDEIPEMADAVQVSIRFREVRVVEPELGDLPPRRVASPQQSSTVNRGTQQTTESDEPTKRRASVLSRAFS
jgi:hypothetical protein